MTQFMETLLLNENAYFTSMLTNIYILCRYGVFQK